MGILFTLFLHMFLYKFGIFLIIHPVTGASPDLYPGHLSYAFQLNIDGKSRLKRDCI